ncbi:MAG: hypothetical protein LC749_07830, partial [Actinobacteria bacterium]|nr:hypothetical protein [Actinomycetota bacterium]
SSGSFIARSAPMGAAAQPALSGFDEISPCLHRVLVTRRCATTKPIPWRKRKIMPSSPSPVLVAIGAAVVGVSLAACGGSTPTGPSAASAAAVQYAAAPGEAAPSTARVSANSASEDDIATALKAAGVSSPKRWAAEVVEYRPYATDDSDLAKLRQNLVKYNPGQQTVDKIVSTLRP